MIYLATPFGLFSDCIGMSDAAVGSVISSLKPPGSRDTTTETGTRWTC